MDNGKYATKHDVIENRTCIPLQTTEGQSELQYFIYVYSEAFIWIALLPSNLNA